MALESHDASWWPNVVAASSSLGKYLKGEAGFLDALDACDRVLDRPFACYVLVESEKVTLSGRTERDPMSSYAGEPLCAGRDVT